MRRALLPSLLLALLASSAPAQFTNVYVDSVTGNDANSGCTRAAPKKTLTSALAGLAACGPAPWRVHMLAGSTFNAEAAYPVVIPPRATLCYLDPSSSLAPVTIIGPTTTGGWVPIIRIPATTQSLAADTGIDGSTGGFGTTRIHITSPDTSYEAAIKLTSAGGFTNASRIQNVRIEHHNTGLYLEPTSGSVSPSVNTCTFTTPGAGTVGGANNPGSEHIAMFFQGSPATVAPTISSCTLVMQNGASMDRAVFGSTATGHNLLFSMSSSTITGSGGTLGHGIELIGFGGVISPSIASTTVLACDGTGVMISACCSTTGSPTITGCSVSNNGAGFPSTFPPFIQGNGITVRTADGANLAPAIDDTSVIENRQSGIVLIAGFVTGPSAVLSGSVSDCEIGANGRDGTEVRIGASSIVAFPASGSVSTAFDANVVRSSGRHGMSFYAYGVPGSYAVPVYPSLSSPITNNMVALNGANGMEMGVTPGLAAFWAPTITHDTIASNVGIGINHPLIPTPPVYPPPAVTQVFNTISRLNGGLDITTTPGGGLAEASQISWSNWGTPTPGYTNFNSGPMLTTQFVGSGDYHLAPPTPIIGGQFVDTATNTPAAAPPLDFDGDPRVIDKIPPPTATDADRGADEVP